MGPADRKAWAKLGEGPRVLLPGQKVGNCEVVRWLNRGSFADVYEARHVFLDLDVALKVVLCQGQPSEQELNEARQLASLSHPHIIKVHDAGVYTDPESARSLFYIATELASGGSLRDRISAGGRVPWVEAVEITLDLCDALGCAHSKSIVHRDVKPENILFAPDKTVKLADFGVSRFLLERQVASTIVGTASYLAPEGWSGATYQSDIWSVGVVLYEMIAGRRPFGGATPAEVETQIKTARPRPLRALVPEVPRWVETAVERSLAKHPAERFQRIGELAAALRGQREVELPVQQAEEPTIRASETATAEAGSGSRSGKRTVIILSTAAGTVVIALLTAFVAIWGFHKQPSPGEETGARPSSAPVAARTTRSVATGGRSAPAPGDGAAPRVAPEHPSQPASDPAARLRLPASAPQPIAPPTRTEDPDVLYAAAREKLRAGQPDEAERLLTRCVAANPRHVNARFELARLLERRGDLRGATRELEAVVALVPQKIGAHRNLANLYAQQGLEEKADAQQKIVEALEREQAPRGGFDPEE